MNDEEIRHWRQALRAELLERRLALGRPARAHCRAAVTRLLEVELPRLGRQSVGCYWPFKGEIDLSDVLQSVHDAGGRIGLPVVVEKGRPLEFWRWEPGQRLRPGVWRIPVPAQRDPVRPDLLLVPLLGFDEAGFRLGYGGGYYDRTLAVLDPRPLTIGVGYELGRLASINPQSHDIPMDAIVTEAGFFPSALRASATYPGSAAGHGP